MPAFTASFTRSVLSRALHLMPLAAAHALAACGGNESGVTDPPNSAAGDTLYTFPEQWSSPEVVIRAGGFVDFVIEGSNSHNAIFRLNPAEPRLPGAPDDIPVTRNQRVRRTFSTAGEFPVVCTVHPGMTARVLVRQ